MSTPYPEDRGCEPLRLWNRLEPRARRVDFSRVLRAEVHDALWMLARQWQFGEVKGEDTGSAVLAKIAKRVSPLREIRTSSAFEVLPPELPFEVRVEREPLTFDPVTRAQTGRQLTTILARRLRAADAATAEGHLAHYRSVLRAQFGYVPSAPSGTPLDEARRAADARRIQMEGTLGGRSIDGVALLDRLTGDPLEWSSVPGELAVEVRPGHEALFLESLRELRAWFRSLYSQPASPAESAWENERLEYSFEARIPRPDGTIVITADEYASGRLDWYSFDLGAAVIEPSEEATPVKPFTVIPTAAEFPGMPNPRFWQFEDGSVDLGNIRADSTDIAKILVSEFALVYGNDWLVVPALQDVGSLAEIEGIVVTDVFGQRTLVESANDASGTTWTRWDFFSLSPRPSVTTSGASTALPRQHLFLPPALTTVVESDALESVAFVRDETTNTVWAVESRIPDGLGSSRDGHDAARRVRSTLEKLEQAARGAEEQPPAPDESVKLRWVLGTTVPENWIPFVPVHKPKETRAIRLQRASMPRFYLDSVRPIRPRTNILRVGIDQELQTEPYFVNEEEIPRFGVVVDARLQRARWFDGTTYVWLGRRKTAGRGEGGSGLRFDVVENES